MADNTVRIIVGLKDDFSRGISRVTNSLEDLRRRVFSLQSALAVFAGGAVLKGFVDTAARMDKTLTLLKRLEGSGEAARASFEWMLKFGQNNAAVANIEQFQQAFVRLKVAGLDPAAGSLQALTDAVAAFGGGSEDLQKASVAVFQMAGKGAINMEELRQQLGERVPTAMKIMARELGITVEQLNKFTETAVLTGKNATIALQALFRGLDKEYGGAAKALASTWLGMVNQLGVKWDVFKIKVMDSGPFQVLKKNFSDFIGYLDSPAGMRKMDEWARKTAQSILTLGDNLRIASDRALELGKSMSGWATRWNMLPEGFRDFLIGALLGGYATKSPYGAAAGGVFAFANDQLGAMFDNIVARWSALPSGFKALFGVESGNPYSLQAGAFIAVAQGSYGAAKGLMTPKPKPGLLGRMTYQDYVDQKALAQATMEATRRRNARIAYSPKLELDLNGSGKAAKQAAAALEQFRQAIREVNKEFAEIQGDQSAVWLAEWEDRFQDLHSRIMKGSNGAEREAALERLKAADQATRAAITAGYKTMVEAEEDLKKFKQELAAFDTGNTREDDRLQMEERLSKLMAAHKVTAEEAERYRTKQNAEWQKELDRQNLDTKRSFYQEYIQIAGEGYAVIEDSILQQAQVFRNAKISEEHIAKWVEYKKLEYSREWADGAKRALLDYANEATNLARGMETVISDSFRGMEDALTEFVKTGKLSFSELADSIISDMMRIMIQQSITGPLAGAAGTFLSGMFSGSSTASVAPSGASGLYYSRGHAKGGWYDSPSLSAYSNGVYDTPHYFAFAQGGVFGEAGPEAIMPLKRDASGNLGVRAEASSTSVVVHNYSGAKAETRESKDSRGNRRIEVVIGEMVAGEISRQGSQPNNSMRGAFGLRPQLARR